MLGQLPAEWRERKMAEFKMIRVSVGYEPMPSSAGPWYGGVLWLSDRPF